MMINTDVDMTMEDDSHLVNWSGVSGRSQEAMIILATSSACFPAVLETTSGVKR